MSFLDILPPEPKLKKGFVDEFFEEIVDNRPPHPLFKDMFEIGNLSLRHRKIERREVDNTEGSKVKDRVKMQSYKVVGVDKPKDFVVVNRVRLMKLLPIENVPEIKSPEKYEFEFESDSN